MRMLHCHTVSHTTPSSAHDRTTHFLPFLSFAFVFVFLLSFSMLFSAKTGAVPWRDVLRMDLQALYTSERESDVDALDTLYPALIKVG